MGGRDVDAGGPGELTEYELALLRAAGTGGKVERQSGTGLSPAELDLLETLQADVRDELLGALVEAEAMLSDTPWRVGLANGNLSCNRTVAEQRELYARGRTKPGKIVTWADGVRHLSNHQGGRAVDLWLRPRTGGPIEWELPDREAAEVWQLVVDVVKSHGFEWGGDWADHPDAPHFQIPRR